VIDRYFTLLRKNWSFIKIYTFPCHICETAINPFLKKPKKLIELWRTKGYFEVDFNKYDVILMPLGTSDHWILAEIQNLKNEIKIYDPLHQQRTSYALVLCTLFTALCKKDFKHTAMYDIPKQYTDCDCGVFICAYAYHITHFQDMNFTQKDIDSIRNKIALSIWKDSILEL